MAYGLESIGLEIIVHDDLRSRAIGCLVDKSLLASLHVDSCSIALCLLHNL